MATRIVAQLHGARRIVVWLVLTAVWAGGTLLLLSHADRFSRREDFIECATHFRRDLESKCFQRQLGCLHATLRDGDF